MFFSYCRCLIHHIIDIRRKQWEFVRDNLFGVVATIGIWACMAWKLRTWRKGIPRVPRNLQNRYSDFGHGSHWNHGLSWSWNIISHPQYGLDLTGKQVCWRCVCVGYYPVVFLAFPGLWETSLVVPSHCCIKAVAADITVFRWKVWTSSPSMDLFVVLFWWWTTSNVYGSTPIIHIITYHI